MKLWYQSMTLENAWPEYNATLRAFLDGIKDADTVIEVHGITKRGGVGDQFRYLEFIETIEVLENVQRAGREGFDAFLIGNIADPGLREAREITRMPVLGLCEISCHVACLMGHRFALVTGNEKHAPRILDNVARYGIERRLAAVERMKVERLVDLNDAFKDAGARERLVGQFLALADATGAAGSEVVIPAIGVLMTLLGAHGVHTTPGGIPILNGIVALVKMGEAAVKMDRIMGSRFTSKRCTYAPPPPEQIAEMRRYYGDVYPEVRADEGR